MDVCSLCTVTMDPVQKTQKGIYIYLSVIYYCHLCRFQTPSIFVRPNCLLQHDWIWMILHIHSYNSVCMYMRMYYAKIYNLKKNHLLHCHSMIILRTRYSFLHHHHHHHHAVMFIWTTNFMCTFVIFKSSANGIEIWLKLL